jgi:O-acetyl-ADP-ribose deacetylase (regulator of RNase III)
MGRMKVVTADITTLAVDAVVNAANSTLLGGGGVDGAIHRKAGRELLLACMSLDGCETGDAKITPGFGLPGRHVIHTVGPVWNGGAHDEDALLAACYRRSLEVARENALATVAFPAISTGIYRFPPDRAARIAVDAVARFLADDRALSEVIFCCFDEASAERHRRALEDIEVRP